MFEVFCGIDEAGRGSLAGPVVSACVILPKHCPFRKNLADSKQLSASAREKLYTQITASCLFGIGIISNDHIDSLGIRIATHLSMLIALKNLLGNFNHPYIEQLLVDGRDNFQFPIPARFIIRGDSIKHPIMAASILAKVRRDSIMTDIDSDYPEFGFARHKGYGTKFHSDKILSLLKAGSELSPVHRLSFRLKRN